MRIIKCDNLSINDKVDAMMTGVDDDKIFGWVYFKLEQKINLSGSNQNQISWSTHLEISATKLTQPIKTINGS